MNNRTIVFNAEDLNSFQHTEEDNVFPPTKVSTASAFNWVERKLSSAHYSRKSIYKLFPRQITFSSTIPDPVDNDDGVNSRLSVLTTEDSVKLDWAKIYTQTNGTEKL